MKEQISQVEFEERLAARLGGNHFFRHRFMNYPNSVFYYKNGDDPSANNEIGIYTSPTAYGFNA